MKKFKENSQTKLNTSQRNIKNQPEFNEKTKPDKPQKTKCQKTEKFSTKNSASEEKLNSGIVVGEIRPNSEKGNPFQAGTEDKQKT